MQHALRIGTSSIVRHIFSPPLTSRSFTPFGHASVRWHGHGHSHGGDLETPGEYSERDAPIYQFGNRDWGWSCYSVNDPSLFYILSKPFLFVFFFWCWVHSSGSFLQCIAGHFRGVAMRAISLTLNINPNKNRIGEGNRAFTVGIGGPVGSGKTALILKLCNVRMDGRLLLNSRTRMGRTEPLPHHHDRARSTPSVPYQYPLERSHFPMEILC